MPTVTVADGAGAYSEPSVAGAGLRRSAPGARLQGSGRPGGAGFPQARVARRVGSYGLGPFTSATA